MAYATVEELSERIGYGTLDNADLIARCTDALDAATAQIDADTGRVFTSTTATRTFGVTGWSYELLIDDVVSVTTLKVDDDDDGVFEVTIPATGFELDRTMDVAGWPFDVVRLLDREFPYGSRRQKRVEIAGVFGWSAVPVQINQACTLLAARFVARTSGAVLGVQSFGDAGAAMVRGSDPDYMRLIRRFTRPQVA